MYGRDDADRHGGGPRDPNDPRRPMPWDFNCAECGSGDHHTGQHRYPPTTPENAVGYVGDGIFCKNCVEHGDPRFGQPHFPVSDPADPVSWRELRRKIPHGVECNNCYREMVPPRPHTQHECELGDDCEYAETYDRADTHLSEHHPANGQWGSDLDRQTVEMEDADWQRTLQQRQQDAGHAERQINEMFKDRGHEMNYLRGNPHGPTHLSALSPEEERELTNLPPLDLERDEMATCSNCGSRLAPGEKGLCPQCEGDSGGRKQRQKQKMVRTRGGGVERQGMQHVAEYYGEEGGDGGRWGRHGHALQEAIDKHQNYRGRKHYVPIMNNTWIHKDDQDNYHIRHHDTDILSVAPNGDLTVNPGGWHSMTTKQRINSFLPNNMKWMKHPSKAQDAPEHALAHNPGGTNSIYPEYRDNEGNYIGRENNPTRGQYGLHVNTRLHEYEDGFSINAHSGEVLEPDTVRPTSAPVKPPNARGSDSSEPGPRRNRRSWHDPDYGPYYTQPGRRRDPYADVSFRDLGNDDPYFRRHEPERRQQPRVFSPGEGIPGIDHGVAPHHLPTATDPESAGRHYDPEGDRQQLRWEDQHATPSDSGGGYRVSPSGHSDPTGDMPQEGESFEDWMSRTTKPTRFDKCHNCRGKGVTRSGTGDDYRKSDCGTCQGSGYLRADGSPAKVDDMGRLSRRIAAVRNRDRAALEAEYDAGVRMMASVTIARGGLIGHYFEPDWSTTESSGIPACRHCDEHLYDHFEGSPPKTHRVPSHYQASQHTAYGETKAPVAVDTLRDEDCPVCFTPETLVRTRAGYVPIAGIEVGDEVLSKGGVFRRVTKVHEREYDGALHEIAVRSAVEPLRVTPEHPLMALVAQHSRKNNTEACRPGKCGKYGDLYLGGRWGNQEIRHEVEWVEARDIAVGGFLGTNVFEGGVDQARVVVPQHCLGRKDRRGPGEFILTDEFLWMVGLYLAEGSASARHINFALHQKEAEYIDRLTRLFEGLGYSTATLVREGNQGAWVEVYSTTLAQWFPEWLGSGCANKAIPADLLNMPSDRLGHVVQGVLDGDDTQSTEQFGQTSPVLALQVAEYFLRSGRAASIYAEHPEDKRSVFYVNHKQPPQSITTARTWRVQDTLLSQVTAMRTVPYAGKVYNLAVEGDPSYTVQNVLVHNCGEHDAFDGDTCEQCGFVAPPKMFQDPDLEKARLLDLRQDPETGEANNIDPNLPPVDPQAVDSQGEVPGDPKNEEAYVEGDVEGLGDEQQAGQDAAQQQMQMLQETGQPLTPEMLGPDGEVMDQAGGPEDPEAAAQHFDQGGEPFTQGPNAPTPQQPMESPEEEEEEEQQAGEEIAEDKEQQEVETGEAEDGQQIGDEDAGEPGRPGDETPDLLCPACGFEAGAAHPTSSPDSASEPANAGDGMLAGDICPNCQQATLLSVGEMQQMEQQQGQPVR